MERSLRRPAAARANGADIPCGVCGLLAGWALAGDGGWYVRVWTDAVVARGRWQSAEDIPGRGLLGRVFTRRSPVGCRWDRYCLLRRDRRRIDQPLLRQY